MKLFDNLFNDVLLIPVIDFGMGLPRKIFRLMKTCCK